MSSREFVEWMAYYRLEPFGPDVDHAMIAQETAILATVNRDPKKHRNPYTTEDFMPGIRPTVEVDQDVVKAKVDSAMQLLAANAKKRGKEARDG